MRNADKAKSITKNSTIFTIYNVDSIDYILQFLFDTSVQLQQGLNIIFPRMNETPLNFASLCLSIKPLKCRFRFTSYKLILIQQFSLFIYFFTTRKKRKTFLYS